MYIIDNIPNDKSISHRALIFSALAQGTSLLEGILESDDTYRTIDCMRALGVFVQRVVKDSVVKFVVESSGYQVFRDINHEMRSINFGNSGTTCRLMIGLISGIEGRFYLWGDTSLSRRPMNRVIVPLRLMGASIISDKKGLLPMTINGNSLQGISYKLPIASAQVKSCLLLAGLYSKGYTQLEEPLLSRDHTEKMMNHLDIKIDSCNLESGKILRLAPLNKDIPSFHYRVFGDFSSCAFFIGLSLITKVELTITNIILNPLRTGLLSALRQMGADIDSIITSTYAGELIGDIHIRPSALRGIAVDPSLVPTMIDEFPILAVIASFAEGKTTFFGIKELKYKESNRIEAIMINLKSLGVRVSIVEDNMIIHGSPQRKEGGCSLKGFFDHRIVMAFIIMSYGCERPLQISNQEVVNVSFPNFFDILADFTIKHCI